MACGNGLVTVNVHDVLLAKLMLVPASRQGAVTVSVGVTTEVPNKIQLAELIVSVPL